MKDVPESEPEEDVDVVGSDEPHLQSISNTKGFIFTHHSHRRHPAKLLDAFTREDFIKGAFRCQLYKCGASRALTEEEVNNVYEEEFMKVFGVQIQNRPFVLENMNDDNGDCQNFNEFCNQAYKWLKNRGSHPSFALVNYNFENHLNKYTDKGSKIKRFLKINAVSDRKNALLVYISEEDIVLNIRFVELPSDVDGQSQQSRVQNITQKRKLLAESIIDGQNDAEMFAVLHHKFLHDNAVTFASIVAISNTSQEDLQEITDCLQCTKDGLLLPADDDFFGKRIHSIIEQVRKQVKGCQDDEEQLEHDTKFRTLASRVWGAMCSEDIHLPNLSKDPYDTLVCLYLTNEQRSILNSKDKHAIVQGSFGSGKSVLAQSKFMQLTQRSRSKEFVYYVVHSNNSMYTDLVRTQILKSLKHNLKEDQIIIVNLEEYATLFHLKMPLMLSTLLKNIVRRHHKFGENAHVLVDEYNGSLLTQDEANSIKEVLQSMSQSCVYVMCQSMGVHRDKVMYKSWYQTNEVIPHEGHKYILTGMALKTLNCTMRSTTDIVELAKIAADMISNEEAIYKERKQVNIQQSASATYPEPLIKDGGQKVSEEHSTEVGDRSLVNVKDEEQRSTDADENNKSGNVAEGQHVHVGRQVQVEQSEGRRNYALDPSTLQRKMSINTVINPQMMDYNLKKLSTIPSKKTGNKIVSRFEFAGTYAGGHFIEGNVPKLIYPFGKNIVTMQSMRTIESRCKLQFVLKYLLKVQIQREDTRKVGIVCSDGMDILLFYRALQTLKIPVEMISPMFPSVVATLIQKHTVGNPHGKILLCDNVAAHSVEFDTLILPLDTNDRITYQYLVEALMRCVNNLNIIVIDKETTGAARSVVKGIIKKWVKHKLVDEQFIEECSTCTNDDGMRPFCLADKTYGVHLNHEDFDSCRTSEWNIDIKDDLTIAMDVSKRVTELDGCKFNTHGGVEVKLEILKDEETAPQPRWGHIALFDPSNNSLVVTCGDVGSKYFTDLHLYNITTSTWSTTTTTGDVPADTWGASGWLCGHHLWVFGGVRGVEYSNTLYKCDVNSGEWERVEQTGSVPSPRRFFVVWQHKDHVVIFGGYGYKPNNLIQDEEWDGKRNNQVFVLNHTTTPPLWSHPPCSGTRPTPRYSCAYTQVDNIGYLFSGITSQDRSNDFFSINLDTFTWTSITTTGSTPSKRDASAMTTLNNEEVLLCGGYDGKRNLSGCFLLNLRTMRWEEVQVSTFQPVRLHTLTQVDDGKLLLFGGYDKSEATNTLGRFEYDLTVM